jgi:cytochrome c-type protein NapB
MRGPDQQGLNRPAPPADVRRGTSLLVAALLSAVAVGFFAGTRAEWPQKAGYWPKYQPPGGGVPAPTYMELRERALSPNAEIYRSSRATLIGLLPSMTEKIPARDDALRAQALARREQRRAFDGAPPTIPHPADTRAEPNCLLCHEQGARIADLTAPKMSHPSFRSCLQCHAEGVSPEPVAAADLAPLAESSFAPLPFGGRGARAWPAAPPVVPHRSFMRQRCDSCHGVSGALGLRTPHADRQSCAQCHVFDQDLDQGSFFAALNSTGAMP